MAKAQKASANPAKQHKVVLISFFVLSPDISGRFSPSICAGKWRQACNLQRNIPPHLPQMRSAGSLQILQGRIEISVEPGAAIIS